MLVMVMANRLNRAIVIFLLLLFSMASYAENEHKKDEINYALGFLLIEGALLFNAQIASGKPRNYGALMAFVPLLTGACHGDAAEVVSCVGVESIAAYNLTVDTNRHSEQERFRHNMIAWHLVLGAYALTAWLTPEKEPHNNPQENENTLSLALMPYQDGGMFSFRYRF